MGLIVAVGREKDHKSGSKEGKKTKRVEILQQIPSCRYRRDHLLEFLRGGMKDWQRKGLDTTHVILKKPF